MVVDITAPDLLLDPSTFHMGSGFFSCLSMRLFFLAKSWFMIIPSVLLLRLSSYLVFTCFAYASYLPYLYDRTVSTVYWTHFGLCRYLDTYQLLTSDIDLAPPKHSYVFCQMISLVVGHGGGPCTCYDVGK
jgi:hypothetical protein